MPSHPFKLPPSSSLGASTPLPSQVDDIQTHLSSLLAATLEIWCHQLIYVRQVYPRDSFTSTVFLDLQGCCYVQRHAAVVQYISDAIELAVPTLVNGIADQFSLIILEKSKDGSCVDVELERYTLHVLDLMPAPLFDSKQQRSEVHSLLNEQDDYWPRLERAMRNLVLQVHSRCHSSTPQKTKSLPNLTFHILVHILSQEQTEVIAARRNSNYNNNSYNQALANAKQLVNQAMTEGRWWSNPTTRPSTSSSPTVPLSSTPSDDVEENNRKFLLRPIHQLNQGGVRINFVAQVASDVKGTTNNALRDEP